MEKLLRAKKMLDAAEVPQGNRIIYCSLRGLRNWGLTPLQIQDALRRGTIVRTQRVP